MAEHDEARASVVRPYTLTAGRTRSEVDIPLEATLALTDEAGERQWSETDATARIVRCCEDHPSVAEVSARTGLPLGVTRVLVGDLVERGYLALRATITDATPTDERISLIERTLRGLREL